MNSQLMTSKQESTPAAHALWALGGGEALRLDIGPGLRELQVTEGRLWLTREGTPDSPPEDIWLAAGDSITLASGSQWVAEGWGATRFQLLVPPQTCVAAHRRLKPWSSWRRALPSSQLAPSMA